MFLRAPQALHDRVERVLGFLDETLNAHVELTVDFLRIGRDAKLPTRSRVKLDELESVLASTGEVLERRRIELRVRADTAAIVDLSQEHSVVINYQAEIAQGSVCISGGTAAGPP